VGTPSYFDGITRIWQTQMKIKITMRSEVLLTGGLNTVSVELKGGGFIQAQNRK